MSILSGNLMLPFIRGVKLHCYHIQGVPRGDTDATKQAHEGDHPRLAVAKHQEETADTRYDTGAGWREGQYSINFNISPWTQVNNIH